MESLAHKAALLPSATYGLDPDQNFALTGLGEGCAFSSQPIGCRDSLARVEAVCAASYSVPVPIPNTGYPASHSQSDLGLLAVLVVIFSWSDVHVPASFIHGMPAIGSAPAAS